MLPLVDKQRRTEALRYKHLFGQFACLKSWLMLKELLKPLGVNNLEMGQNEHGKPFLVHYPDVPEAVVWVELDVRPKWVEGNVPEAECRLRYSLDGKRFKPVGPAFTGREGDWIGAKVGYFAIADIQRNDGGSVEVY